MSDKIPILMTIDGSALAKHIRLTSSGYEVEGYQAGRDFSVIFEAIGSLDDLERVLSGLRKAWRSCVIRGQLTEAGRMAKTVNRCVHQQADGRVPHWEAARPGRRWVCFDLDKVDTSGAGGAAEAVAMARALLPEPFRAAECVYRLSSSAGLDGWDALSVHFWFWLDRPVYDLSWRRWQESHPQLDDAMFRAVQPHYTADPVWVETPDPHRADRMGRLAGDPVVVPPELLDFAGWQAQHEADLEARADEIRRRLGELVPGEQSAEGTRRYAIQALQGAVSDLLRAPIGGRHACLVAKAFRLGGHCQPGFLSEHEVSEALAGAVRSVFPDARHAEELRTLREMLGAGAALPLHLSHIGRGAGRRRLAVVPPPPSDDVPPPTDEDLAYVVSLAVAPEAGDAAGPLWADVSAKGQPLNTTGNLRALMRFLGVRVRRNVMTHDTEWEVPEGWGSVPSECLHASMMGRIIDSAVAWGWPLSEAVFWRGVAVLEAADAFHPVEEWARSKPWDGVPRFGEVVRTITIPQRWAAYQGLVTEQITRWLIAGGKCLATSASAPTGVAIQGVLVLQGDQGAGKTRWFEALLPVKSWAASGATLDPSNKDSVMTATSAFIVELGELDATTRKADVAMLKSFLTQGTDRYRVPYGRKTESFPRRTIYGASVNVDEFLVDPTGNRRFWVVPVARLESPAGLDLQQVWAEALARAERGDPWWLSPSYVEQQAELAREFLCRSGWEDDFFARWRLPEPGEEARAVRVSDVRHSMREPDRWTQRDMQGFGRWLKTTGAEMGRAKGVSTVRLVQLPFEP